MINIYKKIISTAVGCFLVLGLSLTTTETVNAQVDSLWSIEAPTSNWFGTGNTERGLAFNPLTGNLIVASRQGGETLVILDAETGDSLGLLSNQAPPAEVVDPVWKTNAVDVGWLGFGNTERGIGFNASTGNLIVASRQGGVSPIIVDAATGDSVGILDNTGISGGTFPFNQIRVTPDGQIFTANLAINATTKIYRWADESSAPVEIYSDSLGQRLGDSFGVVGDTTNVTLYLSGSGATKVVPFSWDGATLTKGTDIAVAAGEARGGFSSRAVADSIIISGTGTAPRNLSLDGVLGSQLSSADVSEADLNSSMLNDQMVWNGRHLVATGPAFTNGKFYLFDVTNEVELVYEFEALGDSVNLNNTGGVLFDTENNRLYLMDTNNSIVAYNVADFFPTDVITGGTFTINQIRATSDGQIFAGNLSVGGDNVRIYRWENEEASPEMIFAGPMDNAIRYGDSFGAVGSGNDVKLFMGGSNNGGFIARFDWDGSALTKTNEFNTGVQNTGRGGFSSTLIDGDSIAVAGTFAPPRLMNINDGGLGEPVVSEDVDEGDLNSSMTVAVAEIKGKTLVALGPAFNNGKFYLFEANEGFDLITEIGPLGLNANGNGTGATHFDVENQRLYIMETNNAIRAYDLADGIFADEVTIAEARALDPADEVLVRVKGVVNSTDFGFSLGDYFIQDETGGINITNFNEGGAQSGTVVEPGDSLMIVGVLAEFRNQINIEVQSQTVISSGNDIPDAAEITFADLDSVSAFQGMRVQLSGLTIIDEDDWPTTEVNSGSGVNVRMVDMNDDTVIVRIARNNTFYAAGTPVPKSPLIVKGTMGQFFDDTQIFPFFDGDVAEQTPDNNEDELDTPLAFKLNNNYPNPFNPSTNISYELPQSANVTITVFDITGRKVAEINEGRKTAGYYNYSFDASSLASGMYIYRLDAGSFTAIKKMTLIK